jgi:CDP-glucose 4,6-dehydratase
VKNEKNDEKNYYYKEDDKLGGHDPYSASKAAAEMIISSNIKSFFNPADFNKKHHALVASARAGNVIGGGDFSKDRLIPDIINSLNQEKKLKVRNPDSIRPWQHVLDCLNGYIALANNLNIKNQGDSWNFGPDKDSFKSVQDILDYAKNIYSDTFDWILDPGENPHEAGLLTLDSSKAEKNLQWNNKLDFEHTLAWTFDWYNSFTAGESPRELSEKQVHNFLRM